MGTTRTAPRGPPSAILQEAFGFSQGEIAAVLDALDPLPSQSWVMLGSEEAHGFSVAETELLVSDETIRKLLRAMTRHAEGVPTSIQDAGYAIHSELAARMHDVKEIGNLPNLNIANPAIAAEVVRVVEHYL